MILFMKSVKLRGNQNSNTAIRMKDEIYKWQNYYLYPSGKYVHVSISNTKSIRRWVAKLMIFEDKGFIDVQYVLTTIF